MSTVDVKGDLHDFLRGARETLVWKLEGLGEYDIRRPLTPTGTNLLGLVKHNAAEHLMYFGDVFGRSHDTSLPWTAGDSEPNADMWARPEETREDIVALYRQTGDLPTPRSTSSRWTPSDECGGGETVRSHSTAFSST